MIFRTSFLAFLSFLPVLGVFFPIPAFAGGGFSASCHNESLQVNNRSTPVAFFKGICDAGSGHGALTTTLDLNNHVTNNNGTLAWERNGGFVNSCHNVRLSGTHNLSATCTRKNSSQNATTLNLDNEIANRSGHLTVIDGF